MIKAAGEIIETEGIDKVSLRVVGRKIGVTQTTLYRHFSNKNDLLETVAVGWFSELGNQMSRAAANQSEPFAKLESALLAYARYVLQNPLRYKLMLRHEISETESRESSAFYTAATQVYGIFEEMVNECRQMKTLPLIDNAKLTALIYCSCHGILDLTLAGHLSPSKGLDALELISLLLKELSIAQVRESRPPS